MPLEELPDLWKRVDLADRRRFLMSALEAVCVERFEDERHRHQAKASL